MEKTLTDSSLLCFFLVICFFFLMLVGLEEWEHDYNDNFLVWWTWYSGRACTQTQILVYTRTRTHLVSYYSISLIFSLIRLWFLLLWSSFSLCLNERYEWHLRMTISYRCWTWARVCVRHIFSYVSTIVFFCLLRFNQTELHIKLWKNMSQWPVILFISRLIAIWHARQSGS